MYMYMYEYMYIYIYIYRERERERVLFIGTQFSILYTSMYSPAGAATHSCQAGSGRQKRCLSLSTFSRFLIVNKTSLSPTLALPAFTC